MATQRPLRARRPRGRATTTIQGRVTPEAHALIHHLADKRGLSIGILLEEMIHEEAARTFGDDSAQDSPRDGHGHRQERIAM